MWSSSLPGGQSFLGRGERLSWQLLCGSVGYTSVSLETIGMQNILCPAEAWSPVLDGDGVQYLVVGF